MSVPPKGAGPRGTLPLGIGLALPSPYASRHAEREGRATARPPALSPCVLRQAPELPEWEGFDGPESEPAAVEPHRSAQSWGDVAQAPRAPALPAPVRLRGRWSVAGAILTALGAVAIVGLVVNMSARPELPELPELRQAPELHAAQTSPALTTPEPAPPAAPTSSPASVPTSTALAACMARAMSTTRAVRNATAAIIPTSDIVDPWRHIAGRKDRVGEVVIHVLTKYPDHTIEQAQKFINELKIDRTTMKIEDE